MYRTHFLSNDLDKVAYYKNTHTLNKLKWTCKSSYYKQQFELNKNNLKNTWKLIGTIINRKPKGHTVPANSRQADKPTPTNMTLSISSMSTL